MGRDTRVKTKDKPDSERRAKKSALEGLFSRGARGSLVLISKDSAQEPEAPKKENVAIRVNRTEKTMTTVLPSLSPGSRSQSEVTQPIGRLTGDEQTRTSHRRPIHFRLPSISVLILGGMAALVVLIFLSGTPPISKNDQQVSKAKIDAATEEEEWKKKVLLHRVDTGTRLNRERIKVEIDNLRTAPSLSSGDVKIQYPPMMKGVPLAPEAHHRTSSRERLQPANPDAPDARVRYLLQDEQAAAAWEAAARKQYIDEVVANAARAGYKVRVSPDGVLEVLSGPRPGFQPPEPPVVLEPAVGN